MQCAREREVMRLEGLGGHWMQLRRWEEERQLEYRCRWRVPVGRALRRGCAGSPKPQSPGSNPVSCASEPHPADRGKVRPSAGCFACRSRKDRTNGLSRTAQVDRNPQPQQATPRARRPLSPQPSLRRQVVSWRSHTTRRLEGLAFRDHNRERILRHLPCQSVSPRYNTDVARHGSRRSRGFGIIRRSTRGGAVW